MANYLSPATIGGRAYLAPAVPPQVVRGTTPVRFDFPASYEIEGTVIETPSDISAVTVTPEIAAMKGGTSLQLSATVEGTNSPNLAVIWSANAGVISQDGVFNAPQATSQDRIILVRATSVQDASKWDESTITVVALPTVAGVIVLPSGVEIAGGASYQFSALVQGTNEPSQAVTWSTTLGEISVGGVLTAPMLVGVNQAGTVTATSVLDPTKSGSLPFLVLADVTLPDQVIPPVRRFARPRRDISRGGWVPSKGNDLFAMVDDIGAGDDEFISATTSAVCELALRPVIDPNTSSNQAVRYRAYSPSGAGLTVELRQGTQLIASWTHDALPAGSTLFEQALTGAQCDSITNYADLRIKFVAA